MNKKEIINSLSNLPYEEERNFEVNITDLVLNYDEGLKHLENHLIDIIHSSNEERIQYYAFYALNILLRREKNFDTLAKVLKEYKQFEKHPSYTHLKVLYYNEGEPIYDYDELLTITYEDAKNHSENAGFVHLFADLFASTIEKVDYNERSILIENWYSKALDAVNRAIELDNSYAKYYCTKARILSIHHEYEEAIGLVNKAISLEKSERKDYALRIGNYLYYKSMIINDRDNHDLRNRIRFLEEKLNDLTYDNDDKAQLFDESLEGITPPKAYNGNEDYVFVSYSHKDAKKVYSIIEKLQEKGIRVWYDEGIKVGSDFIKEICDRIDHASNFLIMISPYSLNSFYVRKEIFYATNESRHNPVSLFITPTTLTSAMKFQLGNIHNYHLNTIDDEIGLEKLYDALQNHKDFDLNVSQKISLAGREYNEDYYWISDNDIVLLDGSTSLKEASYTAINFVHDFIENYKITIKEEKWINAINKALSKTKEQYELNGYQNTLYPSASVIFLHKEKEKLQLITIGDCTAMLIYQHNKKKHVNYIKKSEVEKFDNKVLERLKEFHKETGKDIKDLMMEPEIKEMLVQNRMMMNQKNGYRILSFNMMEEISNEDILEIEPGYLKRIVLYSDGFNLMEKELSKLNVNLDKVGQTLRKTEKEDESLNKYPRFKQSDDATALIIDIL